MSEQEITQKLEKLAEYREKYTAILSEKMTRVNEIMTDEIRARLVQLDDEFAANIEATRERTDTLEDEIKQDVIRLGTSVKGTYLYAIWSKGRVSWDTKSLDGYATAHPELLPFRKEGEPTVYIRSAK